MLVYNKQFRYWQYNNYNDIENSYYFTNPFSETPGKLLRQWEILLFKIMKSEFLIFLKFHGKKYQIIHSKLARYFVDKGGYASKHIAKAFEKKGGKLVLSPEGFFVKDEKGPLAKGELERAAKWAEQIVK